MSESPSIDCFTVVRFLYKKCKTINVLFVKCAYKHGVKRPFSTAEVHGIVGPLGRQLQSSTQDNIHVYKTNLQYLYYNVYYILLACISSFFR